MECALVWIKGFMGGFLGFLGIRTSQKGTFLELLGLLIQLGVAGEEGLGIVLAALVVVMVEVMGTLLES